MARRVSNGGCAAILAADVVGYSRRTEVLMRKGPSRGSMDLLMILLGTEDC